MPPKAKPLPLPLVDPASHPPPGFRAMLIRRAKLKYPEMFESQIARYVGCSPSNVHCARQKPRTPHSCKSWTSSCQLQNARAKAVSQLSRRARAQQLAQDQAQVERADMNQLSLQDVVSSP